MTVHQLREVLSSLDQGAIVFLREDDVDVLGSYLAMDQLLTRGVTETATVLDPEDDDMILRDDGIGVG